MRLQQMFILAALLALPAFPLSAQDAPDSAAVTHQEITLLDGTEAVGIIISESENEIVFRTLAGVTMTIPRAQVKEILPLVGKVVGTTFYPADPNYTRLFFAPTARALKRGQGYFAAYEIFFPWFGVGFTDHITLAGGMSLFPAAESQLYYLSPKFTFYESGRAAVAGGLLHMGSTGGGGNFGIWYGVASLGLGTMALTGGFGYGYSDGKSADEPVLMIGGEVQISRSAKLISENWFFPGERNDLITFGIRFFGRSLAADFALMKLPQADEGFPFLPWISFVYNFGTERMAVRQESEAVSAPETYEPPSVRFSAEYVFLESAGDYKGTLESMGFQPNRGGDDLFDNGQNKDSKGTRIAMNAEYLVTQGFGIGLGLSSTGRIVGSPAAIEAVRYFYGNVPTSYYGYYTLREENRCFSASILASFEPFAIGSAGSGTSLRLGVGGGLTDVSVGFRIVPYGEWNKLTSVFHEVAEKKTHALLFSVLEQRASSYISIGLKAEYFILPKIAIPQKTFGTGYILYDYSQTPPGEMGMITDTLPAHEIDLKELRLALMLIVNIP